VSALLRVSKDHLDRREEELRLSGCRLRELDDVVLDVGGRDLLQLKALISPQVRQYVETPPIRRRLHVHPIPVKPPLEELIEPQ
jgi:hypothetical protein